MKDFIICLSHFCEIHGPTSIICTQSFQQDTSDPSPKTDFSAVTCLSCAISLPEHTSVIRTKEPGTVFISQQYPSSQSRYKVLRQIVMKCLSVETTYDDLKPIMFGESSLGFAIAMSFKIKDNTARGSERKYAFIVLAEEENELMRNWDLIIVSLSTMIKTIKDKISHLESTQQASDNNNERFYRRILPKPKNLIELLNDDNFFVKVHLWSSNLLKHLKND